jgi:hypothetical protein
MRIRRRQRRRAGKKKKQGSKEIKKQRKKAEKLGKEGDCVPTYPVLANSGAMSQFIGAFEVTSKLSGQVYQCRFSHMWNGIATRHSDTIDTKFFVDGEAHVVGLAHTAFVKFRERTGRDLTDREASYVAAEYLRERLEEDDIRSLYDVAHDDVLRLIAKVGLK